MASQFGTTFVKPGRYVSNDGTWVIIRNRERRSGRARTVLATRWYIGKWDKQLRAFAFDGTFFPTLKQARAYLSSLIEYPF